MPTRTTRRALAALGLALLAALATGAGCGGDGAGDDPGAPDAAGDAGDASDGGGDGAPVQLEGEVELNGVEDVTASGAQAAVQLSLEDDAFTPTFVKAAPGATVAVALANRGERAHTFTIESLGVDRELAAGATATVEVELPSSGVVRFACRFHQSGGMQGAFYFTGGETAAGDY